MRQSPPATYGIRWSIIKQTFSETARIGAEAILRAPFPALCAAGNTTVSATHLPERINATDLRLISQTICSARTRRARFPPTITEKNQTAGHAIQNPLLAPTAYVRKVCKAVIL